MAFDMRRTLEALIVHVFLVGLMTASLASMLVARGRDIAPWWLIGVDVVILAVSLCAAIACYRELSCGLQASSSSPSPAEQP